VKWGTSFLLFAFGLSLGLLWHYKTMANKTEPFEVKAERLRSIIKKSSKQIVTEVQLSEKVTINKNIALSILGEVNYKTASAIGSGVIQYGFDWEEVEIEIIEINDSTVVYFTEPDIYIVGLSDLDIAYTELSSVWGTSFNTNEIYQLNQALKDSLYEAAEKLDYFIEARKNLPKSLAFIKTIVEEGFNATFVYVPKNKMTAIEVE